MRKMPAVPVALACGLVAVGVALGGTTLKLTAVPAGLKYDKKLLKAVPGSVTITMKNASPLPHNVAIKGAGVNVVGAIVSKGGTSTVTATLKKGSYVFYCSVPGHEAAGMKGTLQARDSASGQATG